jgi:hypothetical protein
MVNVDMHKLGVNRSIHYFSSHGEANTNETIKLAKARSEELGIRKIIVASETGLSALKVVKDFMGYEVIVVSSAAGTHVRGSVIGDLKIGISDEEIYKTLINEGCKVIRGTDPFWNISASTQITDIGQLGMMFYEAICGGLHVCITAVVEATDTGYLRRGEEVVAMAGSFVGLDTAIVATASNSVDFFKDYEVNEIICKPRKPRYTWPINHVDWKGDLEQYRRFVS